MNISRGNFFWLNGEITDIKHFKYPKGEKVAYEVLRIINGKPLFLDEHLQRLNSTLKISGIPKIVQSETYWEAISLLCQESDIDTGNIEIIESVEGSSIRFIPHRYPSENDYRIGVAVGYFYAERLNPNAKLKNHQLRHRIHRYLQRRKLYEVLLVSHEGFVTEGSRSNIFFVDSENCLITAPQPMVLPGITRQIIMQLCAQNNIPIVERKIRKKELKTFVSAFISGTSPGILPISIIGSKRFSPTNSRLLELQHLYRQKAGL